MTATKAARGDPRLLERDGEVARIDETLRAAASGTGSGCLIEGPPGIGKSELLRAAARGAQREGLRVHAARGVAVERPFAFGVARRLLERPARTLGDLAGPAALGLAALGLEDPPARADAFALVHGLFWLCAELADREPMAILVDDAHWIDEETAGFLAYLHERLDDVPVALIVATRDTEAGPPSLEDLRARFANPLQPRALSVHATATLLEGALGAPPPGEFARALHDWTGGRPFELYELAAAFARARVEPTAAAAATVPERVPDTVHRRVAARLAALPEAWRAALEAVAILEPEANQSRVARLADLEDAATAAALDALAQAGLVKRAGPLETDHPLLRAAVEESVSRHRRSLLHRAAARVLESDREPIERVAAHLVLAEPDGDPWTVDVLASAAENASGRGGPRRAVEFLERALAERTGERCQILLSLAEACLRFDPPAALAHADAAIEEMPQAALLARARHLRSLALVACMRVEEAVDEFGRAIDELGGQDLELTRRWTADRLMFARGVPALASIARRLAEAVPLDMPADTPASRVLLAVRAGLSVDLGGAVADAADAAERALAGGRLIEDQTPDSPIYYAAVELLLYADRFDLADRLIAHAAADAERRGAVIGHAASAWQRGRLAWMRGRLDLAEAEMRLAFDTARQGNWFIGLPFVLTQLIAVLTERGASREALDLVESLGLGGELPEHLYVRQIMVGRAIAKLAAGDAEGALAEATAFGDWYPRETFFWRWRVPAALAARQLADTATAKRLAQEEVAICEARGGARHRGIAHWLRAIVCDSLEDRIAGLERAVATLAATAARFDHARALVDLGGAQRRARRIPEARITLSEGLAAARACGAIDLAAFAREEVLASGLRPRREATRGVDSLTPSERRVAEMAASGRSNREIAQALFVTRKTVEKHLSQVYAKLGIGSRGELEGVLRHDARGEPRS